MTTTFTSDHAVAHVLVELQSASLEVRSSANGAVSGEVIGSSDDDQRVRVDTWGSELRIAEMEEFRRRPDVEMRVRLFVPDGMDLTFKAGSGHLDADASLGRVVATSGSGNLRLTAAGAVRLHTGSGSITAGHLDGDAEVSSGSGQIRIDHAAAALNVKAASGGVAIGDLHGPLQGKLASGNFQIRSTTGSVTVRTASGNILIGIAEGLPAWLDVQSGSGNVDISIPPSSEPEPGQPFITIHARSGSGNLAVRRA